MRRAWLWWWYALFYAVRAWCALEVFVCWLRGGDTAAVRARHLQQLSDVLRGGDAESRVAALKPEDKA